MKNIKILSLGIMMLICFAANAQEKAAPENTSIQKEIKAKSFSKAKDTITDVKVSSNLIQPSTSPTPIVICAPSRSRFNDPVTILDGTVITSSQFSKVNPNDIQDIKVLKGAEATAIYGNQGINGVIIITTKKKSKESNSEE